MEENILLIGLPLKTWLIVGGLFIISALSPSIAAMILIRRKKVFPDE